MKDDLKQLEKKLINEYFDDGLWEIYVGLLLVAFGVGMLLDITWLPGVASPLLLVIPQSGKKLITVRRIGFIQFRTTIKRNPSFLLAGILLLGLITYFSLSKTQTSFASWLKMNMHVWMGLVFGGALIIGGFFTGIYRFFLYGLFLFLAVTLSNLVGSLEINFTIVGLVITASGFFLLLKFIHEYPISNEEN